MSRSSVTRFAAPVAFLAAITIGALVVRAGFQHGKRQPGTSITTVTTTAKKHSQHQKQPRLRRYTVQSGETLSSIAAKTGTTVARLEQLNPGIDPTALRVGEKIRVK